MPAKERKSFFGPTEAADDEAARQAEVAALLVPRRTALEDLATARIDPNPFQAAVQYPLNLPAGPGGLGPKVSLSYNSGAVDRVDPSQQGPSSVGWGWTLSTSYIAATLHGGSNHAWTPSIVTDGINGDLAVDITGTWHTANESFARIQYDTTTKIWDAWDKSGTRYHFDIVAYTLDDPSRGGFVPYRWLLHTITDVHNNVITYTYKYEDANGNWQVSPPTNAVTSAIYPETITWGAGGDTLQAVFTIDLRMRLGVTDAQLRDRSSNFAQLHRVTGLAVYRRQQFARTTPIPVPANGLALLRSYTFGQDYTILLKGVTSGTQGQTFPHLTLTSITTKGNDDGATTLPATTLVYYPQYDPTDPDRNWFTDQDTGHLYQGHNGYGGQVRFYYDLAGADVNKAYRRVRNKRLFDGLDDVTLNTVHNTLYSYLYRGATLNTVSQSQAANQSNPLHSSETEFRGFSWVQEQDPLGQVTDHYYSQDDGNVGQAWRVQTGKTFTMTDGLTVAPSDPQETARWTTNDVALVAGNGWQTSNTGSMTRTNSGQDGSDVSLRLKITPLRTPAAFVASWQLQNPNNPNEYWGLQIYSVGNALSSSGAFVLEPKLVWNLQQPDGSWATGTRDLAPTAALYPRRFNPVATDTWYRLQLHLGTDGRVAMELYNDQTLGDYLTLHSGDLSDVFSGDQRLPIPATRTGQAWQFVGRIGQNNASQWQTFAQDYTEQRTVYAESNSVYGNKPHAAEANLGGNWQVGSGNNVLGMTIRYRPVVESGMTTLGDWTTQPGQSRRTHKRLDYDSYGNQTAVYDDGNLASSSDDRTMYSHYLADTLHWIVDKPEWTKTYQTITADVGGSNWLAEQLFTYNTLPGGQLGDLIKVSQVNLLAGIIQGPSSDKQFAYDSYGNPTQTRDPNGNGSTTTYDGYYQSFPLKITYANTMSETTSYDYALDMPISHADVNGTVTESRYDSFGRPSKTWTTGFGTETTPNQTYSFADRNLPQLTPPFYISLGQATGTGSTSTWATRWFDGRGRTLQDDTPQDPTHQIVVNKTYIMTGQVAYSNFPYAVAGNNPLTYTTPDLTQPGIHSYYDGLGRTSVVVNADNTSSTYDYSWLGWVGTKDESSHQKWQHTDLLGRLDSVQENDALGHIITTGYAYTALDQLTTVTRDQGGVLATTATRTYDGLGRKATMQDPDMGTWQYDYDLAGNLTAQRDALYRSNPSTYADHQVFFTYDTMNRPSAKYYGQAHSTAAVADVKYYYDNAFGNVNAWGKLRRAEVTVQGQGSNANGHSYEYDARGLLIAEGVTTTVTTRVYTTTYTLDIGGRPSTLAYPDSATAPEVVTLGYNTQGPGLPVSLTSNVSGNPAPVSNATYNARAQLLTVVQGVGPAPPYNTSNLLTSSFSYDDSTTQRGWLTNLTVTSAAGTHLNETLGYTANGNIASVAQSAGGDATNPTFTNVFSYDGLDRLITAVSTAVSTPTLALDESYSFDTLGRMTSRTVGGTTRPYSYGTTHKDAPTNYNGTTYTYDANGSQVGTSAGQSRTFDPEGRLSSVSDGTTVSAYIYDANGQRLLTSVTAGGTTRRTLYVGGLYEEQLGSGSINYYMFGGKAVGLRRSGWPSGNGQYRLVGDHLGSTTLLVDTATPPTVVQRQYHKPYGEIAWQTTPTGGSLTSVGFTGQRLDSDTGLMYYGARFYDPALGYFVSADTIAPDKGASQSRNRYAYVLNNPLIHTDPTGQCVANENNTCSHETAAEARARYLAELDELGIDVKGEGDCLGCLTFTNAELRDMLAGIHALMDTAGWKTPAEFKVGIGLMDPSSLHQQRLTVRLMSDADFRTQTPCTKGGAGCTDGTTITFNNDEVLKIYQIAHAPQDFMRLTVHELAHAWDNLNANSLSAGLDKARTYYLPGNPYPQREGYVGEYPLTRDTETSRQWEEWAETVVAVTFYDRYPQMRPTFPWYSPDSRQAKFVRQQFVLAEPQYP